MWVPSIQGFTDPQGIQSRDHRHLQGLQGQRGGIGIPGVSNSPLSSILVYTNSNCCPKKATLAISSSLGEKGTPKLAVVPLQREHKPFGQRNSKGKVGFEHLEATKLFISDLPN